MKEIPILFSTAMVRAIIDGRKTVTRRVCKCPVSLIEELKEVDGFAWFGNCGVWKSEMPYQVGDTLWVRETWCNIEDDIHYKADYIYRADGLYENDYWLKWRPSIHLPRKAARLFLRVTDVRAERLQDITNEDAIKEGVGFYTPRFETDIATSASESTTARTKFCSLWDSLNARRGYGWDANPWVFRVGFEKI